jgi:hypothetical protein
MRIVIVVLATCLAIIQPRFTRAQDLDTSRLQEFTRSNFYAGLLNRTLASIPPDVFKKCPTLVSNGSKVTILKPVAFGADGFPNAGTWMQSFPVSGCGNDTTLHIFFSAGIDKKINTVVGFPGGTVADLRLQRDAFVYAMIGVKGLAKDCNAFNVKNTRFEGFGVPTPPVPDPGPDKHLRPWRETWTMIGCGRTIDVPMDFIPRDTGGTQIIQPGGAVEIKQN